MLNLDTPTGFRSTGASGLFVPVSVERRREVWSEVERKALDRASKVCKQHKLRLTIACPREGCSGHLTRLDVAGVGDVLRCDCTDRVLSRNV